MKFKSRIKKRLRNLPEFQARKYRRNVFKKILLARKGVGTSTMLFASLRWRSIEMTIVDEPNIIRDVCNFCKKLI